MKHKSRRISVGLLVLSLVLVACSGSSSTPSSSAPTPAPAPDGPSTPEQPVVPVSLTVGGLKIAATVPIYLAVREGFFADEALEVTFEAFSGGAEILPVFAAGGLDIAFSNHVTTVFAAQAGVDFKCVTGSDNSPASGKDTGNVIVPVGSAITTVSDLEGKTIAVNNRSSLLPLFFSALLDQNGVDPSTIDFVEVPLPSIGDALAGGQADAAGQVEPFNTILESGGVVRVLSPLYQPVLPGVELGCYGFTGVYINENPDVVARFVRAFERGKALATSDKELTAGAIAEWTGADPALIGSIVWSAWLPGVSGTDMQAIADLMLRYKFIPTAFDASTAVDESFVD